MNNSGYNNFGDEINLLEMIKNIKKNVPLSEITVYSRSLWHTFMKPKYPLVKAAHQAIEEFRKELNTYDLIVIGGGGLIYLGAHFFTFLDEGIKKPYIFSRVGVDDRVVKEEACSKLKYVLQKAAEVTVRTTGDKVLLNKHLNIDCDVVPEAIWNFKTKPYPLPKSKKNVLIALNAYSANFRNNLKKALSQVTTQINENIISMQDTSLDFYYNIQATNQRNRRIIPDSISLEEKGACLAAGDLTITSRLHAGLVSISHGVPTIMLKSTPKVKFLMDDLQLSDWYVEETITHEKIEALLEKKQKICQNLLEMTNEMRAKSSLPIIYKLYYTN
ncbi:polysaccharide pyruvyl transferase family protein [Halalkalibacterium halodurans]|uniref:polysaccharide pyruvyl transferase family protein n=1 Tax=Halalkalibacterium halodurans TaxID=86665 RepID=UPI0010684763|nr:polysaccharide pyruvyl transferase family protein [Halalkalibacterium halodurans]TES47501.1 polysaccharide pyruvyl transferase family protein [Halalkalibacterium halodurans]